MFHFRGENMEELKRCPFCGELPICGVEFCQSSGSDVHLAATVKCISCGVYKRKIFKASESSILIPFINYENAFEKVVKDWNERQTPTEVITDTDRISIQDVDKTFESCSDCIHFDDDDSLCILRGCIHAVAELKECYTKKPNKDESND